MLDAPMFTFSRAFVSFAMIRLFSCAVPPRFSRDAPFCQRALRKDGAHAAFSCAVPFFVMMFYADV